MENIQSPCTDLVLNSVSASPSGTSGVIDLTVNLSWSGCTPADVVIEALDATGNWQSLDNFLLTSTGNHSSTNSVKDYCDRQIRVKARCHYEQPWCVSNSLLLNCSSECPCLPLTVSHTLGACVNSLQYVNFSVSIGALSPQCPDKLTILAKPTGSTASPTWIGYSGSNTTVTGTVQLPVPFTGSVDFYDPSDAACKISYPLNLNPCNVEKCCPSDIKLEVSNGKCVRNGDACCREVFIVYSAKACPDTIIQFEVWRGNMLTATFTSDYDGPTDSPIKSTQYACSPGNYKIVAYAIDPISCKTESRVEKTIEVPSCNGECSDPTVDPVCCPSTSIDACIIDCIENAEIADVYVKASITVPADCSVPIEAELTVGGESLGNGGGTDFTIEGKTRLGCGNHDILIKMLGNESGCTTSSSSICVPVCETDTCSLWRSITSFILSVTVAVGIHTGLVASTYPVFGVWLLLCFVALVISLVVWVVACKKNCLWKRLIHCVWVGLAGGYMAFLLTGKASLAVLFSTISPIWAIILLILVAFVILLIYLYWYKIACPTKCQRRSSVRDAFEYGALTAFAFIVTNIIGISTPAFLWGVTTANATTSTGVSVSVYLLVPAVWFFIKQWAKKCKERCPK